MPRYLGIACALLAFGLSSPAFTAECTPAVYELAKDNVDWVFEDEGARDSYARAQAAGCSWFWAVIYAQRHNRPAQSTIIVCTKKTLIDIQVHRDRPPSAGRNDDQRCKDDGFLQMDLVRMYYSHQ